MGKGWGRDGEGIRKGWVGKAVGLGGEGLGWEQLRKEVKGWMGKGWGRVGEALGKT